eukprot:383006-Amphidinium_carterae.1
MQMSNSRISVGANSNIPSSWKPFMYTGTYDIVPMFWLQSGLSPARILGAMVEEASNFKGYSLASTAELHAIYSALKVFKVLHWPDFKL